MLHLIIKRSILIFGKKLVQKRIKSNLFAIIFLVTLQFTFAQNKSKENIEFLSQDSFENLLNTYQESKNNHEIAKAFSDAFLLKAKLENNVEKKIEAYELIVNRLAQIPNYDLAFKYLDSIIDLTINNTNYTQPAQAHIIKANIYGSQAYYTEAMDELAKANSYANDNNNSDQQSEIRYFIALLKNEIGEYKESLALFKENIAYYKSKVSETEDYKKKYIQTLYATGNQFNIIEEPDSALSYTNKAINLSLKTKDSIFYDRLILSAAASYYRKKEYQSALNNIEAYKTIRKKKKKLDFADILRIENYYGLINYSQGKKDAAIKNFIKVDSISHAHHFFPSTLKNNYEILIEYYRSKNNTDKQLEYIDKLLAFDKVLDKDATYLSKKINDAYNTPNLILEKQKIIDALEKKNTNKKIVLSVLSILTVALLVLLVWNYNRQKRYKKRFQELLQNSQLKKSENFIKDDTIDKIDLGISEDIVDDLLHKLEDFEEQQGFLQMDLSVNSLSKQFETNTKYFSKIINTYKNKSFTNYINELRIQYLIKELKTNSKFRKYTIKAIANEIGFNTTEAFSKSFYKVTQLHPSYFIKNLERQNLKKQNH